MDRLEREGEPNREVEVPLFRVMKGLRVSLRATVERDLRTEPPSAAAKSLALGHRLLRAVETGEVDGVSDLARKMGVSHNRVSALIGLTYLAPDLQEAVLVGRADVAELGFHSLLALSREQGWERQRNKLV